MFKYLRNLSEIAEVIGGDLVNVQGSGGNISVKLGDGLMAIKASGFKIKDLNTEKGFSVVDLKQVLDLLGQADLSEDDFVSSIKQTVVQTNERPSIETGFHAFLKTYVIHSHSVYANLLTCSRKGKTLVEKIFPDALWVEYASPGKELTLKIKKAYEESLLKAPIIFLQNHGLIVHAENSEEALKLHDDVNLKILSYFNLPADFDVAAHKHIFSIEQIRESVLFPDQVVFTHADSSLLESSAAHENIVAYSFIRKTLMDLNLEPVFLSRQDGDYLLNMESEKFRQGKIKDALNKP